MVFSSLGLFLGFPASGSDGFLGWALAMGALGLMFF
jgi:hypothetical protein